MTFIIKKNIAGTDGELIAKYLDENNMEALGVLYQRYMHLVYGVCLKYLKNREESKDAVIQIFEKLIAEIKKHEVKNFKSWLYVLTKNFCLMELRKSGANERKIQKYFNENFMDSDENLHPIDETDNLALNSALQKCIEKLKNGQKQCIKLFYYEEKCYQEIADFMSISLKEVKSFIQNGKRNLKICLENNYAEEK